MSEWKNFGDVNPVEHGGMFVQHDEDIKEVAPRCFYAIKSDYVESENKWAIIDGYVDLDDDWIEWEEVKATMDTPSDADDYMLVCDVMYYYGTHLSDGVMNISDTEEDTIEFLKEKGISDELLNI